MRWRFHSQMAYLKCKCIGLQQSSYEPKPGENEMTKPWRLGRPFNPRERRTQLFSVLLWTVTGLAVADRAFAETGQSGAPSVEFDIPAQAVPAALGEFARQAGVQLLFISDGFEDIQANAVIGTYATQHALDLLLAGTGLAASISADSQVKLRSVRDFGKSLFGTQLFAMPPGLMDRDDVGGQDTAQTEGIGQDRGQNGAVHPPEVPKKLDEILVTGSRIRGAQSASPIVTITSQDIENGGFATVGEVIDKLPQNFSAGASPDGYANEVFADDAVGGFVGDFVGGTSVNLRGLGASSTLVLFNGRRMSPSGRSASFTDISGIPLSAIERIEVLTDGASAIYGSDAIGGVINFITRDDFEGAETRLRYGSDSGGDTSEILLAQSFGMAWEDGNILLSYEYFHHNNLANRDRSFAASNDLTRFGGDDFRPFGGSPANIFNLADGQTWAIPAVQDGTALTGADFDPAAPLNRHSPLAAQDMLPQQQRHSAFLSLSQQIGVTELFSDVRLSLNETKTARSVSTAFIVVPSTNPFFIDPFNSGLGAVGVSDYSFVDDLGPNISNGENDSYGVALGVRFDIGEAWNAELAGSSSKEEASARLSNFVDPAALAVAVAQTDPNLAFNPFGDGSSTDPAVLDMLRTSRDAVKTENEVRAVNLNVDGSLFNGPAGAIQLAAGTEYREESLTTLDVSPASSGLVPSIDDSREVTAAYAELFFPLVSDENRRSGIWLLELSLAGRYEHYSDFGSSTNAKYGIAWSPTQSMMLRGTWGTSFRAPQLTDLNVASTNNVFLFLPQFFVDIGAIPFTTLVMQGANGSLRPEEATTWTAGVEWSPQSVKGLWLSMTYFDIDFEDRIDVPFSDLTVGYDPRFTSLLNTNPTAEQIAAVANDPRYQETTFAGTTTAADLLSGAVPVGAIMDARINNLSQSVVTGLELQLSYAIDTSVGTFDIGFNGNYLFDFERALLATDPLIDEVDTLGRPVDFRARSHVSWTGEAWSASGFVNYMDGYTDTANDPERPIRSWTTVDLTVAYDTDEHDGLLGNTRLSLTAHNVLDETPPFVNNFGLSYDPTNASGLGAFLAIQLTKEW